MTQEVTTIELAWLAGFWDGEGSITIFTHLEKNGQQKICPTLLVVNTDEPTMAHVADILDRLGTSFHFFKRTPNNPKHKPAFQLSTRNALYIKVVLDAMLPYLVTKKAQAFLTLRYINKKLEQRTLNERPRYDEEDFQLQEAVQAMNKKGAISDTSTTKGEAPDSGDDIV